MPRKESGGGCSAGGTCPELESLELSAQLSKTVSMVSNTWSITKGRCEVPSQAYLVCNQACFAQERLRAESKLELVAGALSVPLHSGVRGIGVMSEDLSMDHEQLCMHLETSKLKPSDVGVVLSAIMMSRSS
jgi:hypothetical protein